MKKILLGFALGFATLSMAQQYPNNGYGNNGYGNNGYGNDGYSDGYYSDDDDQNYFPDDYYYNYPQDYYPQNYYQSYYNDYRNSIININWNVFFAQNRLTRWQIDQILYLNNLYTSFSTWNNFYRYNPDRWYYDRFYALERIMGPRIFVVFQNSYYQGYTPIVYFQNYRRTYYAPRYTCRPQYRNININTYRVNRVEFRRNVNPTLNVVRGSGFRNNTAGNQPRNNGGFRDNTSGSQPRNNGGFRDNTSTSQPRNNGGFRGDTAGNQPRSNGNSGNGASQPRNNGGFRDNTSTSQPRNQNYGGGRGEQSSGSNGGFRNGGEQRQNSGNSGNGNSGGERSGGFRTRLAGN